MRFGLRVDFVAGGDGRELREVVGERVGGGGVGEEEDGEVEAGAVGG